MRLKRVEDNIELIDEEHGLMAQIPIDKNNHNIRYFLIDVPACKAIEISSKFNSFRSFAEEIANLYRYEHVRRERK